MQLNFINFYVISLLICERLPRTIQKVRFRRTAPDGDDAFQVRLASKGVVALSRWVLMFVVILFFLTLLGPASLHATPAQQKALVGCVNRLPNGTLQFGAVPSGELFQLRGQTNVLEEHVNQLVRIFGETASGDNDNKSPSTLIVDRVEALSQSCTSALPAKELRGVPGKVGEDAVAVPQTTTATENQTTPGFQTENAAAPSTGSQNRSSIRAIEPSTGPPRPDQIAQSQASADMNASAVERSEITPGRSLGVSGYDTTAGTVPAGTQPASGASANAPSSHVVVTITGSGTPKLSPSKVTIKKGETVQWLNSSAAVQELIDNPARETKSGAALPASAKPFDSGFLRQGERYERLFSVPGVYHYVCKVNNSTNPVQALGEVIVQP